MLVPQGKHPGLLRGYQAPLPGRRVSKKMKNPVVSKSWELAVAHSDLSAKGKVVCFTISAMENNQHNPMVSLTMSDLRDLTELSEKEIRAHLQRAARRGLVKVGFGPYADSMIVCRTLPSGF